MRILALEVSTEPLGVAASEGKQVLAEFSYLYPERRHAEFLFPFIQRAVADVGWKPEDIDLFAVAQGPGSFTGVRLGLTAAKALAWALGKPLVAVSTLELWAAVAIGTHTWVAPVLDARNDNVYAALYHTAGPGALPRPILEDRKDSFPKFLTDVRGIWLEQGKPPVSFVGANLTPFSSRIRDAFGHTAVLYEPPMVFPRAGVLASLAALRFRMGHTDPFTVQPVYFRTLE